MRACIQRVSEAAVRVDGTTVGSIQQGLLVLLGVAQGDDASAMRLLADKIIDLRIFPDAQGRMNLGLRDVDGAMLVVSQFTLLGDCRKGRRPSFTDAAPPDLAESLYAEFVEHVRQQGVVVATGLFAANMRVALVNDGPVTLWLDTEELSRRPSDR